jgi:uncharacterized protein (DUF1778 family)
VPKSTNALTIKNNNIRIRLNVLERAGLDQAAELSGLKLSDWARVELRAAAERRLTNAGTAIPWAAP